MEPHEIAPALARAADLIRRKARRLARRRDFLRADEEDVAQVLTARVLARLPGFDPAAIGLDAFLRRVVNQGASVLIRDRHASKRHDPGAASLDHAGPGGRAAGVPDGRRAAHRGTARRPAQDQADLAADVGAFLRGLPPEERALAEALLREGAVAAAARAAGVPRGRVYAALRRWEGRARAVGLDAYLENPPAD